MGKANGAVSRWQMHLRYRPLHELREVSGEKITDGQASCLPSTELSLLFLRLGEATKANQTNFVSARIS